MQESELQFSKQLRNDKNSIPQLCFVVDVLESVCLMMIDSGIDHRYGNGEEKVRGEKWAAIKS